MFSPLCQLKFFYFHTFQYVEITARMGKGRECDMWLWFFRGLAPMAMWLPFVEISLPKRFPQWP
jgi:hypothetical protein